MSQTILIRSPLIVSSSQTIRKDLLIKNGIIASIKDHISYSADLIIDGKHLVLMPGVLDPHVHFREPGLEWKETIESGSHAAAKGGVTSFFDMPNNNPPTTTINLLKHKKELAAKTSLINFNFFIGANASNLDEINSCGNIPGAKIFMGSSTGDLLLSNDQDLEKFFADCKHAIVIHAEHEKTIQANKKKFSGSKDILTHEKIRSQNAALIALKQAISLADKYNNRLHLLHITSKEEISYLRTMPPNKFISAEATPQHLLLYSPLVYEKFQAFAQVNPPIRTKEDQKSLWQGLKDGVIHVIATDHAPHTKDEKEKSFPNTPSGMPGIETSLPLMLNLVNQKKCSINQVVEWMCENPCRIFKVKNKGFIKEGYDADIVLVDMKKTKTLKNEELFTKVKWSIFNGMEITGWPLITIVNGNIVYNDGKLFTKIKGKEILIESV